MYLGRLVHVHADGWIQPPRRVHVHRLGRSRRQRRRHGERDGAGAVKPASGRRRRPPRDPTRLRCTWSERIEDRDERSCAPLRTRCSALRPFVAVAGGQTSGAPPKPLPVFQGFTSWSTPVNLGAPVNTPFEESSPAISSDQRSLYFNRNPNGLDPTRPDKRDEDLYVANRTGRGARWSRAGRARLAEYADLRRAGCERLA